MQIKELCSEKWICITSKQIISSLILNSINWGVITEILIGKSEKTKILTNAKGEVENITSKK